MRERIIVVLLLTTLLTTFTFGQLGSIKGTITDSKNKETLIGATVLLKGTTIGTTTDFDGNYILANIKPGNYNIVCSYISYETVVVNNITIKEGTSEQLNFELSEALTALEEVTVVGKANREAEAMLLMEQKEAVIATQSIGAQELSRKGVSDAEGAVSKISGVSKQEGVKNIFVRGLGDRYNSTTLNGFALPSEDPEYKNISLDIFGSDMIQAVGVNKVFSSNMSGDVGGALINVKSKELVKSSELKIDISVGSNTQTQGKAFLNSDGVNALGYANINEGPKENTAKKIDEYSFQNSLNPISYSPRMNQSISFSGGKKFSNNRHRFFLVGAYNTDYNYQNGVSRKTTTANSEPFQDFEYDKYLRNTSHMLMGNIDFNYDKHQLSYNSLYLHTNRQYFAEYFGIETEIFQNVDEKGSKGLLRRQQINDNSIIVNQLIWKWQIVPKWSINSGVALNSIKSYEPDRRSNYFSYIGNEKVEIRQGDGRQQRFYNTLNENDLNIKTTFKYSFSDDSYNKSAIHFGYFGRFVARDFAAPIYDMTWYSHIAPLPVYSLNNISLDEDYNQESLDNGSFSIGNYADNYQVEKYINGAYANFIYQLNPKLIADIGVRLDQVFIKIDYDVNKGGNNDSDTISEFYFLPSLNIKYDITEKHSFRFGASQTYTLPQAKEISPFTYVDVDFSSTGNPNLKPSINYNLDIKWDYYISRNEVFTINGFYKYILDPIARVDKGNSAGLLTYDNISDHANASGIELEFRKNILENTNGSNKHNLNLGLNGSYIYTIVDNLDPKVFAQNTSSQLEGAAPIILNGDLTYILSGTKTNWTSTVVLNYLSDKVHTIGTKGYNNIFEKAAPTLDFISSVSINKHLGIKVKVQNILDSSFELTRIPNSDNPPTVLSSYKKGIAMSLGVSCNF